MASLKSYPERTNAKPYYALLAKSTGQSPTSTSNS